MTHTELVDRAAKWLRNSLNCKVVAAELVAYTDSRETPDAIGWVNNRTILVECKTSRADYAADRMKRARQSGAAAMGNWRFYMTPPGLLSPSQIPEGWGLYEVHRRSVKFRGGTEYRNAALFPFHNICHRSEAAMLLSIIRRSYDWERPIVTTKGVSE